MLRAGEDAAGVRPRRRRHAQLLPRGGRRRGVQPGGGGRRVTEEPGRAAGGLGARPFLARPSKPASVLGRVRSALRMLHLFEVIVRFSSRSSPRICLGGKEKVTRSGDLSVSWAGTAFVQGGFNKKKTPDISHYRSEKRRTLLPFPPLKYSIPQLCFTMLCWKINSQMTMFCSYGSALRCLACFATCSSEWSFLSMRKSVPFFAEYEAEFWWFFFFTFHPLV